MRKSSKIPEKYVFFTQIKKNIKIKNRKKVGKTVNSFRLVSVNLLTYGRGEIFVVYQFCQNRSL